MARVTIAAVNAALKQAGFENVELVKGNGYWYFAGEGTSSWYGTSVYTYHISDNSIEGWVNDARELSEAYR